MKSEPEGRHGIWSSRVGGISKALALAAALLILPAYFLPLWNLTMFAPQYGDGLSLDIYSHKLESGNAGQDLKEINLLNHYIGMRDLAPEDFTEFRWLPVALGVLALVFLGAAALGHVRDLLGALVVFTGFGIFSLWSFASTLYRYGHELAPTAPVKIAPFMPPLFGSQQLANFEVYSYPSAASWSLAGAGLALALALGCAVRGALRRRRETGAGVAGSRPQTVVT